MVVAGGDIVVSHMRLTTSGDIEPHVGATDIAMLYSVTDVEKLNQLSRTVIATAALVMVEIVTNDADIEATDEPTIGITMFGVRPRVRADGPRVWLEACDYKTIVFHATGTGDRAMKSLIREGVIDSVLDVTTTEKLHEQLQEAGRD